MFTRLPVLYEDPWLIAVNKPEGVLSHPNPAGPAKSGRRVQSAFEGAFNSHARTFTTAGGSIWLIHRLDQDTSGVLLATRDAGTAETLRTQFEQQAVHKTYLALVAGKPLPDSGTWRDHLEKQRARDRVRSMVRPHRSPNAELRYTVQQSFSSHALSLIEITLITGRTHQIRVQATARGHPVAGDRVYGNFQLNRDLRRDIGLRRLFLHARQLSFNHPHMGKSLAIEAPLPEELQACLQKAISR